MVTVGGKWDKVIGRIWNESHPEFQTVSRGYFEGKQNTLSATVHSTMGINNFVQLRIITMLKRFWGCISVLKTDTNAHFWSWVFGVFK